MVTSLGVGATRQIVQLANMSPTTQRIIIGATGLVSQTTIDALNPYADAETRKYSAIRTAIRMIICTLSGATTRFIGQKLGEYAVKAGKVKVPEGVSKVKFASSLGYTFAIVGAVASIFFIDVPFINRILNTTMEKFFNVKTPQKDKPARSAKVNFNA